MKNQWSLGKLIFKANILHPALENACDYVKSNWLRSCSAGLGVAKLRCYLLQIDFASNRIVSINEIYEDIHQYVSSLFYALFRILSSTRAFGIFLFGKTSITGHYPLICWWPLTRNIRFSNADFFFFLIATESRRRPQTKQFAVSNLGSL